MSDNDKKKSPLMFSLWSVVRPFFDLQWKDFIPNWIKSIPAQFKTINDDWDERKRAESVTIWQIMTDFLKGEGVVTPKLEELFRKQQELPGAAARLVGLITYFLMMMGYIANVLPAIGAPGKHKANVDYRPELVQPDALIQVALIDPTKIVRVKGILAKWGYSEEQIELLFTTQEARYNPDMLQIMFLRGVINEKQLLEHMKKIGFDWNQTVQLMQTWQLIPGPQDLFHLVAKEAFEPDMIKTIGLGDEFPSEQLPWLEKQGISPYWSEKYWYAHWDQPSIQMGYEMLHRKVINDKELDMLFRAIEMPPFWRDKLKQISYLPYTRVDIRRMFDLGVVDIEAVYKNYQDLGYDEEHALKMTEFTVAYVDPEDKNLSKGEILGAYNDKVITEEDCLDLLKGLGYKTHQAEFYIASAEYAVIKKTEATKIKVIKDKFILRIFDKFETVKELNLLNLDSARLNLLIEQWDIEVIKDNKFPSKSDLEKFWLNDFIADDTWRSEMDRLGYSDKYRNWYFMLMQTKKKVVEDEDA